MNPTLCTCHRCNGRGVRTGLVFKPLRRVAWRCTRCAGTGSVLMQDRAIVGTGVRRAAYPTGYEVVPA